MTAKAYYNEIDPGAAQWLRNLIAVGHIAPGDVDERSIADVRPEDLYGYTQCHFFAGVGVWSYALRNAGWGDDKPVWTGSCPCQPFSSAGKSGGFDDERHLWPFFHWLIEQRRPAVVFGEQVASKAGEPWIDLVQADVEALGYAFGCVPFPSAGVGAPHLRDRAYWVADARGSTDRPQGQAPDHRQPEAERSADRVSGRSLSPSGVGHPNSEHPRRHTRAGATTERGSRVRAIRDEPSAPSPTGSPVADSSDSTEQPRVEGTAIGVVPASTGALQAELGSAGPTNGFWRAADWLFCRDGKWRPVEPGTFPLAHGAAARVVRLRAYGNAINAEAASAFIECYQETRNTY